MRARARAASLLRNVFRRTQVEGELAEEVGAYLELLVDGNIARSADAEQARRTALIELGGAEQVKEQVREVRMGTTQPTVK